MSRNPWAVVVIMSVSIVCVTVLAIRHIDTSILVGLIGATILPVVTMIYGSVETTKAQTNGTMTGMVDLVRDLAGKVYASHPTIGPDGGTVPDTVTSPPTESP